MLARDWYYTERRRVGIDSAVASLYDRHDNSDSRAHAALSMRRSEWRPRAAGDSVGLVRAKRLLALLVVNLLLTAICLEIALQAVHLARARFDNPLLARIDARFDAMLGAGALEEVAMLAARNLDPLLPAMKAHGVPALIRYLGGEITREQAAEIGRADTRHYAKRQFTWFRHQLPEFEWVKPDEAAAWLGTVVPG